MRGLIAFVLSLLVASAVLAANSLDASVILKKIQERGPRHSAKELWDSSSRWVELIKNVESGKKQWLEVAKALRPGTDAGASEMLGLATGVALLRSPREVLLLLAPVMGIDAICGFPDTSDDRYKTQKLTLQYLDARISTVKSLVGAEIAGLKDQCLEQLNRTKAQVLSPSGPFSANSGSNPSIESGSLTACAHLKR